MKTQLSLIAIASILVLSMSIPQALAFDINSINVTLADAQVDEYADFDIITTIFSIFNNGTESAHFEGPNMLYLNDTNADWWEYSNAADLVGYTETDCPSLDVVISPGNSTDVKLCYLVQHDATIGYSLIANNHSSFMDMDIQEIQLESVPDWFKTTALAWCSDSITDVDYFNSLEFNIQQETINVMRGISGDDLGAQTPAWVKASACDWSNDLINEYDFLDSVYWLIDNGKIQLN